MIKLVSFFLILLLIPRILEAQDTALLLQKNTVTSLNDTTTIYNKIREAEMIYLDDPDSAMQIARATLLSSRKLNYTAGMGLSFAMIGHVYWVQSYNTVSLFYLRHALLYLEKTPLIKDVAKCYRMLGRSCVDAQNFKLGIEYLTRASDMSWNLSNPELTAEVYNDLARYYEFQKDYDTAWKITREGFNLAQLSNSNKQLCVLYARLGNIMVAQGKEDVALKYYDSSRILNVQVNNKRLRAILYNDFSKIYLKRGRINQSIKSAVDGMLLADSIGAYYIKLQSMELLIRNFDAKGNMVKKIFYLEQLNHFRDSIDIVENDNSFSMLQEYFTMNDKMKEMEKIESESKTKIEAAKYQRNVIAALAAFIVALIFGIFAIYYLYNQKEKLNKLLTAQKEEVEQQKDTIEDQSKSLQQLNDLKSKLFAVISHDLRTPISNLKMTLDFFQDEMLSKDEAVELMQKMIPLIDAADLTLSNLLNWATTQMQGPKVKPITFSLYTVVEELKKVFDYPITDKYISVINKIDPAALVFADEDLIKIVMRNLISNAIKFTNQNGVIEIAAERNNEMMVVCVKDNGKGMSADEVSRLFNTGTHFTGVGTGGEKGTGLGLLLCRDLIIINGGRIWVESEPSKGSTFYFNLPAA